MCIRKISAKLIFWFTVQIDKNWEKYQRNESTLLFYLQYLVVEIISDSRLESHWTEDCRVGGLSLIFLLLVKKNNFNLCSGSHLWRSAIRIPQETSLCLRVSVSRFGCVVGLEKRVQNPNIVSLDSHKDMRANC